MSSSSPRNKTIRIKKSAPSKSDVVLQGPTFMDPMNDILVSPTKQKSAITEAPLEGFSGPTVLPNVWQNSIEAGSNYRTKDIAPRVNPPALPPFQPDLLQLNISEDKSGFLPIPMAPRSSPPKTFPTTASAHMTPLVSLKRRDRSPNMKLTQKSPSRALKNSAKSQKLEDSGSSLVFASLLPTPKSFVEWSSEIPVPSSKISLNPTQNPKGWFDEFKHYIAHLLKPVLPKNLIARAISPEFISGAWRRAVTTEGFGADSYESFEMIGDKLVGTAFALYILTRKPDASSMILTNYTNAYMSKTRQPILARAIGLHHWILLPPSVAMSDRSLSVTDKFLEDVFEAMMASIFGVCTLVRMQLIQEKEFTAAAVSIPDGLTCIRRFIDYLFDGRGGLDSSLEQNVSKTTLANIASIYGMDKRFGVVFSKNPPYGVKLPKPLADAISESLGRQVPEILSSGFTDEIAATDAAYETLASLGADLKWITMQREESSVKSSISDDLYESIKALASRQGFPKIFFKIVNSSKRSDGVITIVLRGADINDNQLVLAQGSGRNVAQVKEAVAQTYLETATRETTKSRVVRR